MMNLSESVSEFCASQHFFFLEDGLKSHAEQLLSHWAANPWITMPSSPRSTRLAHSTCPWTQNAVSLNFSTHFSSIWKRQPDIPMRGAGRIISPRSARSTPTASAKMAASAAQPLPVLSKSAAMTPAPVAAAGNTNDAAARPAEPVRAVPAGTLSPIYAHITPFWQNP